MPLLYQHSLLQLITVITVGFTAGYNCYDFSTPLSIIKTIWQGGIFQWPNFSMTYDQKLCGIFHSKVLPSSSGGWAITMSIFCIVLGVVSETPLTNNLKGGINTWYWTFDLVTCGFCKEHYSLCRIKPSLSLSLHISLLIPTCYIFSIYSPSSIILTLSYGLCSTPPLSPSWTLSSFLVFTGTSSSTHKSKDLKLGSMYKREYVVFVFSVSGWPHLVCFVPVPPIHIQKS